MPAAALALCALAAIPQFMSQFVTLVPEAAAAETAAGVAAPDISGIWWTQAYTPKIRPGVSFIVLTPEGKAAYARNMAGLRDGTITDAARKNCAPDGVPRIMAAPLPFQISQEPDRVTLRFEVNNSVRTVLMDRPIPSLASLAPAELGHSYGHWERDTLVVETVRFTPDTFLDATGLPHSDELYVKEFFWRSGPGGAQLQYVAIVVDGKTYSQLWVQRHVYDLRRDTAVQTYTCGRSDRDLSKVAGAAAWK
jgi:hypothetical protein